MKRSTMVAVASFTAVAVTQGTAAHEAVTPAGVWQMNEPEGATVMTDSSGKGNNGAIPPEVFTGVEVAPGEVGYEFTGAAPVQVPHHSSLNPGSANFSFEVSVQRTGGYADPNLIQKGQTDAPGGYYKIDYYQGRINCKLKGSAATKTLVYAHDISDGRLHTIRCVKLANEIQLWVNGGTYPKRKATVTIGSIANLKRLTIGGKINCTGVSGCDWFTGRMNHARVDKL